MARRKRSAPGGTKSLKETKAAREKAGHKLTEPWWRLEGDKAAESAASTIGAWISADQVRQNNLSLFARLYGSADLSFSGTIFNRQIQTGANNRIQNSLAATFNGIQSCVDTIANTVAAEKPVVQFAATGGDYDSHRVAKMRARFIAGWFYEQEVYAKTAIQFRDSGAWGAGVVGVFNRYGRAVAERVFCGDLFVDPASCITNDTPREMARVHLMDRHSAWMMFEGDAEAQAKILDADQVELMVDSIITDASDMIQLTEWWRLPSYDGAGDGRYMMATNGKALEEKEWKHNNFPFAFINCTKRLFGFWPQGLAEQLENLQLQYNDLSYSINEAIELAGRFKLAANSTSNVVVDSIDNEIGSILRVDGPIQHLLWEAVQPEVYERLDKLEQQFYRQSGVAQMVANQEKPSPDESGIAIRERVGIFDQRHALWTQSYQDSHLMLARLAIQTVTDILEEEKDADAEGKQTYTVYSVKGPKSDPIDFADLKFTPDEQYVLTCMPANKLPDTIEGRVALAQDFVQNGFYDEATARSVFLAPFDTARVETMFNASMDFYSMTLDAIIEHNTQPAEPDGRDNLAMGVKMALQHRMYAKVRGVPQDRIDTLEKYITAMEAKMLEKAPADSAPDGSPPLANPAAPPTSALLPNPNAPVAA